MDNMKRILYTQNTSSVQPNTIVIDDNVYSEFQTDEQIEAFRFICEKDERESDELKKINKLKRKGKIKSMNFKFFTDSSEIFVKGCFVEKDDVGRSMPYMFWMNTDSIEEFSKSLNEITAKLGRTCQDDILEINELLFKNINKKIIYTLLGLLLILIIVIWNIQMN